MSGLEFSATEAVFVALIFVFGGLVKGATGFGLPLTTVSLMPLFIPLDLALALNTLVVPLTNAAQFAAAGGYRRSFAICWPLIIGLAITVFATAFFIVSIPPATLSATMGIVLIGFVLHAFLGRGIRISDRIAPLAAFVAGLAGGIVGAVLTAPGPVYAAYLSGLGLTRQQLISAMGLAMLASGLLVTGAFAAVGILDGQRALLSGACVVPGLVGMWMGDRIGRRISAEAFNRLILLMLLALGIYHCVRGLSSL